MTQLRFLKVVWWNKQEGRETVMYLLVGPAECRPLQDPGKWATDSGEEPPEWEGFPLSRFNLLFSARSAKSCSGTLISSTFGRRRMNIFRTHGAILCVLGFLTQHNFLLQSESNNGLHNTENTSLRITEKSNNYKLTKINNKDSLGQAPKIKQLTDSIYIYAIILSQSIVLFVIPSESLIFIIIMYHLS
jgi:hypothetical protein